MPPSRPCILYRDFPGDWHQRIRRTLVTALDRSDSPEPLPVFFRADDVGVLSTNFLRLLDLFQRHRMPLCLGVVPTWLTRTRWTAINTHVETSSTQWCWHQHGWSHTNHQATGKKCEFGSARSIRALRDDLERGRDRLQDIMGRDFSPFFTPPWNRCSQETLSLLSKLGFRAVSRSKGEQGPKAIIDDFYINVDLHTRKEADGGTALEALCDELGRAVEEHYVAIMVHHQLMSQSSFDLLDLLLSLVSRSGTLKVCTFNELRGSNLL
jgi:peptidoglycan/xylan/chitin deacetylase (PgdA/CDA1 family)